MIEGIVNRDIEPVVPIEIADSDGHFQARDVILDTGFSGELALPYYLIDSLGLPFKGPSPDIWTLATGAEARMYTYVGTISWHGRSREVIVLETESESLLGASLLSGNRVLIDYHRGGRVVIEEEWPT